MFGGNPFVLISAREISDPLTGLVKQLEQAAAKHYGGKRGSVVVINSEEVGLDQKLKELAEKEEWKTVLLSIYPNPAGHPKYEFSAEAEVTVVGFHRRKVVFNFSFRKGALDEKATAKIVALLPDFYKAP